MGFGKVPGHLIPLLHPSSKVPLYLPPNDESPRIAEAFEDAPGEIRTPDPLIRSQMLYPAELRARNRVGF